MWTLLLAVVLHFFDEPPAHAGKCGLNPEKAYSQYVMGRNIGYYVEIRNETDKEVDAVEWEAYFYDSFDEFIEKKSSSWSSGNIIKPCKAGELIKDVKTVWVKKANKVFIKIRRVHYTDGSTCGKKAKKQPDE